MKRITLLLLAALLSLCANAQLLAVDKTNRLSDDKLIICGIGNSFDSEAVNSYLQQGLAVVSLGYTDSGWTIAMARGSGYHDQRLIHSGSGFPEREVSLAIERDGYSVTSLAYGNGAWRVVLSKGSPYGRQRVINTSWKTNNVQKVIEDLYAKGEYITASTYGNGRWVLVMSPCSIYSHQRYCKTNSQQINIEFKNAAQNGYSITGMCEGDGEILLVTSRIDANSPYAPEDRALIEPTNFRNELNDFWQLGYHIVSVCNVSKK